MLSNYFLTLAKGFNKKVPARKTAAKKGKSAAVSSPSSISLNKLQEILASLIPSNLTIDRVRPVNSSGFSPEGADVVIFRNYCSDIVKIMNGYIPWELVHGTVFFVPELNRSTLADVLNRVAMVKKISRFTEAPDQEPVHIPAFIVAGKSDYDPMDLKNDIINYYMSKSVDHDCEMDIMMVLNRFLLMKNWREKRSFIGLETGEESFLWFFILMNEYLEGITFREIDFRKYIRNNVVYKEY